ncbi:hypothetical protein JHK82_042990 [Glycine max]|nr:hypothetical protein JHK82_042990 [Glycine max]
MGSALSTPDTAEHLVGSFVGDESIPLSSDFWQKLLELPFDAELPSQRLHQTCQLLVENNHNTRHLAKILFHLACYLQESMSTSGVPQLVYEKAVNAVYFTSVFLKHLIESAPDGDLLRGPSPGPNDVNPFLDAAMAQILPTVPWYKERLLLQSSLGSLMVIILIRTIQYNLSKLRDVYLHTTCLATLANLAPHVHRLSAYASQRLVSLFGMLSRKYNKLADLRDGKLNNAGSNSIERSSLVEDMSAELQIYTDFLRLVLEIINAILTYALPRNPEVVYEIMHKQEVFQPFKNHPCFNELVENIYTVLDFFNSRMDAQRMNGDWSVNEVLQVIIVNCRSWRADGMKEITRNYVDLVLANGNEAKAPCNFEAKEISASVARSSLVYAITTREKTTEQPSKKSSSHHASTTTSVTQALVDPTFSNTNTFVVFAAVTTGHLGFILEGYVDSLGEAPSTMAPVLEMVLPIPSSSLVVGRFELDGLLSDDTLAPTVAVGILPMEFSSQGQLTSLVKDPDA